MMEQLNEGDVVVVSGPSYRPERLAKISRVTATQAVIDRKTSTGDVYAVRFRRNDGCEIGGGTYERWRIRKATEDDVKRLRREEMRRKALSRIRNTRWQDLPTDRLLAIATMLATAEGANIEEDDEDEEAA